MMPVLGVAYIVLTPFFIGYLIMHLLRERSIMHIEAYAVGFLSLFALLFFSDLICLKLDLLLNSFKLIFFVVSLLTVGVGIVFFVINYKMNNSRTSGCSLSGNWKSILAIILLGIVSFIVFTPNLSGESTIETALTTISTNTLFQYSPFTGEKLINGLPIYNKIYVMPLFYAVICDSFKLSLTAVSYYFIPIIVFVLFFSLTNRISKLLLKENERSAFLFSLIAMLISGTYLKSNGIPNTVGFAILREGFSGYAVCYGVLFPLLLLLLLEKKYVLTAYSFMTILPLIRLDRIWFGLIDPNGFFSSLNSSGKLVAVFFVAICLALALTNLKGISINWKVILIPSIFVSYIFALITGNVGKEKKIKLYLSVLIVSLFACNFTPFSGAQSSITYNRTMCNISECIVAIKNVISEPVIMSSDSVMASIRRSDAECKMLYSYAYNNTAMTGQDYETASPFFSEYKMYMDNLTFGKDYLTLESESNSDVLQSAIAEGLNTIIIPIENVNTIQSDEIMGKGFRLIESPKGYYIYIKNE